MPSVVRLGDICSGHGCFPPRPNVSASSDVLANSIGIHRLGDAWSVHACSGAHSGSAATGNPTVFSNGIQICTIGDAVSCGSTMVTGSPNVIAGFNTGSADVDIEQIEFGGVVLPTNQNSLLNAKKLIDDPLVGTVLAIGDEFETVSQNFTQYPPVQTAPPPKIKQKAVEEETEPAEEKITPPTSCLDFKDTPPHDYDFQLSSNFKLRQLTVNALFPHSLKAQRGLSIKEIVCNLQALSENVLEPILAKYPGFRINSGFRTYQNGKSQHETGQAADLQWAGASNQNYWDMALWIKDNINYDQMIFEHGNSIWIHVSFNRAGNRPKSDSRSVMTMYKGAYSSGLKRYYI